MARAGHHQTGPPEGGPLDLGFDPNARGDVGGRRCTARPTKVGTRSCSCSSTTSRNWR